jgi:IMP cyclohydrolase
LVLTKRDSEIEMNPYATGRCIIVLDQNAATKLFDVLGEWLG